MMMHQMGNNYEYGARGQQCSPDECGILAGGYAERKRRLEVLGRFKASSDAIRDLNLLLEVESEEKQLRQTGTAGRGRARGMGRGRPLSQEADDITTSTLKSIEEDIEKLERDVAKYPGPCFTKFYRTLQGHCAKVQMDLDALNFQGREQIRQKRKKAIMKVDDLSRKLADQAHPDGKSCPKCELQD